MAVVQTKAALIMQNKGSELTSHQVISLLLDGALERVAQAKHSIAQNNKEDKNILIKKAIAIVNGLRNSLNLQNGGEIAENLDALYDYMMRRLDDVEDGHEEVTALNEVSKLLLELKVGWDAMEVETEKLLA